MQLTRPLIIVGVAALVLYALSPRHAGLHHPGHERRHSTCSTIGTENHSAGLRPYDPFGLCPDDAQHAGRR